MRKCLRCETAMIEDLVVKCVSSANGIEVREPGLIKMSLGRIKCAVCPECGYIENYIENTYSVKKLVEKDE